MKRTLILAAALLSGSLALQAQKRPLDHDAYDSWQTVRNLSITPDGQTVCYNIAPQEGDGRLILRRSDSGEELSIERAGAATISQDGRIAAFSISAPFAVTRQAKIDKKKADEMPADTLAFVELSSLKLTKIGPAKSFKTGYDAAPYIFASVKAGKKSALIAVNTATSHIDTLLSDHSSFAVSKAGESVAAITTKDKKDSLSTSSVVLFSLPGTEKTILSEGKEAYAQLKFDDSGSRLLFLATDQEEKTHGSPNHSVFLSERVVTSKATRRKAAVTELRTSEIACEPLPEGWIVSKTAAPRFSNSSKRIILSLSRHIPAKDTTLVSFETAGLDIWNYDALTLPPMGKIRPNSESLSASIELPARGEPVFRVLSTSPQDRIQLPDGADADIAVSLDATQYALSNIWASSSTTDISIISLLDGSRRSLCTGITGSVIVSPKGSFILWFNSANGHWYTISTTTGETVNITEPAGVPFYNELDDHPIPFVIGNGPRVMGNDEYILISDRYDVWKFSPDGKTRVNLTQGEGRKSQVNFRFVDLERQINPYLYLTPNSLPTKGKLYLTAFSEADSRNGYYTIDAAKPSKPQGFLAPKSFSLTTKAAKSKEIAYTKGDFRNPMDAYITPDNWTSETKLSSINPQQAGYNWGEVQLVRWQAYDGTPLKGLLYTPDNLDPSAKYPMMIYFYEKYAESLYTYYSPVPSASVVNIPFYVSRGYVVFVPDIIYKDGHPGESAYNCICAGAEAMCKQFNYIDSKRMAIQGQSWGGYQTAYLVTRTNMFAAAGAGAPVGNMTSAYGGIRWESGNSRIPQYEFGQSRVGKRLWDEGALELYIENSPVFFADKVQTPVLIMHNDADGAVPWYQGIEFFMSLRRLQKPAWLLQYNNEAHNLKERRNRKDLSRRLQQFFDYYLQGGPQPAWMKSGIPYARKGNYFGFENAE